MTLYFDQSCFFPLRRLGSLFLICMLFACFNKPAKTIAAEPVPKTLRVLCYNIHYGQGNDGKYNVKRLAAVINKAQPDLVALQEIDVGVERSGRVHQMQELGKLTSMHARFGPTQHYQGGLFGNGILSRLPITDVMIQPLPYTESTPDLVTYPRAAIAVTVRLDDGSPLRFISTHFQHNVPKDRAEEAHAINKHFAKPDDKIPTILAGDMNAKPESAPILILKNMWINAIDQNALPTAPAIEPKSRIDYIFYRNAPNLKLKRSEVILEKLASDHLPVFAIFELKKP